MARKHKRHFPIGRSAQILTLLCLRPRDPSCSFYVYLRKSFSAVEVESCGAVHAPRHSNPRSATLIADVKNRCLRHPQKAPSNRRWACWSFEVVIPASGLLFSAEFPLKLLYSFFSVYPALDLLDFTARLWIAVVCLDYSEDRRVAERVPVSWHAFLATFSVRCVLLVP